MTPPRAPQRPARRAPRFVTATVAAVAVVAGLLLPAAAMAESSEPSPSPTASIPVGTTVFTLSPQADGIVRPGDALSVSISLQNGTDAAVTPSTVTLSLGRTPLADRDALDAWLDGTDSTVALEPIASDALSAVEPGSFQVRGMTVAADDPALSGLTPGVYPLAASYEGDSGTVSSTSAMVVPADDATDVGIGVVVPITAGGLNEGLLTAEQLAELTAPDGDLTNQLDAVTGTSAILAVDPAVPAAIRVLGTSAPDSALEWLTRLESIQNSRFALQFGDADVTAQLQAGLPQPLAPTSLSAYMSPSNFAAPTPTPTPTSTPSGTPTPAPTPTPTPQPGDALPSTDALLAVGPATRPGVYWPADGTADTEIVTRLGDLGSDGAPTATVLPSATTEAGADGRTVSAHGQVGDAEVLVYDSDISSALDAASQSDVSWLRGAPLTTATAYLAFAAAEADGPLLVTVGRGDGRSRVELGAAISAALSAPNVTPRTIATIAASEAREVELAGTEASAERAAAASALVGEEGEIARFATILDQPSLLTGPERADILQLLGVAWIGDDTWPTALADHRTETAGTLTSVSLLPTSPSDLYGSSAALRFWVRNDLPYPVNLVLYTTRDNLRLDVQSETPVVATPQSNTRVEVPVQARVGRGDVTLTLQLRSPAFVAIGQPESVDVNVYADWEAAGIAALAVLVGALLVIGIVRTVLRMRRRRRGTDAGGPASGEHALVGGAEAGEEAAVSDHARVDGEAVREGGAAVDSDAATGGENLADETVVGPTARDGETAADSASSDGPQR
ncbi:hypothetical protein MRBLMI12_001880 [Microbacterium sp. LMI12-1-1.1]|uniref:DUF6049 family protein n=1 Tax=Microbacterium sp. LMI12-1-1.1 TaxID=3135225 RepID=UPI003440AF87